MAAKRDRRGRSLTLRVLGGLVAGCVFGTLAPEYGMRTRFLSDTFVSLMALLIVPIVFVTVSAAVATLGGGPGLRGLSLRALCYFEAGTTLALLAGLGVGDLLQALSVPHAGPNVGEGDLAPLRRQAASMSSPTGIDWIVPHTFLSAFADGNVLQVLLIAVLFGTGLIMSGERGAPVLDLIERLGHVLFCIVRIVAAGAPLAAFGGAAYTASRFGLVPMRGLLVLVLAFYATCALLVFGGLALVARVNGFSLLRLLRFIRQELLVVAGTSSSEPAFPRVLRKLELAGVPRSTGAPLLAGGYSLHLLGTCVYLTMAAVYVAAAAGHQLPLGEQALLIAVTMLTSKSAAGVAGSGLLTLVATLSVAGSVPLTAVALVVGIDRIMSEARAITNLIGNTVAVLVVTNWLGRLDHARLATALSAQHPADPDLPEDDPEVVEIHVVD